MVKKYYKGRIYRGLEDIEYITVDDAAKQPAKKMVPVQQAVEEMYNYIFAVDPRTGFPSGAIAMHLSEKTADDVRTFIEQKILVEHADDRGLVSLDHLKQGGSLSDGFIAQTIRGRFETDEQYEDRLSKYIDDIREEEELKVKADQLRKKLSAKDDK